MGVRKMRFRVTALLRGLALVGLLGGCAGGLPLGPDVVVGGQNFPAARGEADLVVRTHTIGTDGAEREVGGATCALRSVLFTARFTTPARLRMPNFGPQSPDLMIDCAAGRLSGGVTAPIHTYLRSPPGYAGPWGPYGPGWLGPGYYGRGWWDPWYYPEPSYPVWEYPNVSVRLAETPGEEKR